MYFEIYLQFFKNIFVYFQTIYMYILFTDILIKKWQGKTLEFPLELKGKIKFSGLPSPLDKTEPPTLWQIIQYSYVLMNTYPHLYCLGFSKLIAKDVIDIWKAVNPRLPFLKEISVIYKVKILCFQKRKANK